MNLNNQKNKNLEGVPKLVHLWEVNGFVKLSNRARAKFKELIKEYCVRRLSRDLGLDKETIDSTYRKGRKKGAHSIKCLLKIADFLNYDLKTLEKDVTHYGTRQANMYEIQFPFLLTPLLLRAASIHGDGSFYYNEEQNTIHTEWYQSGKKIVYMEKLLDAVISNNPIKSKIKCEKDNVYSISIPNHLIRLICRSLNLKLKYFNSIEFFKRVAKLPSQYVIQVFFQFIVDEGHFKSTTLTVSQKKKWSREGFKILLNSLNFEYSDPANDRQDITIYNYNFPMILDYLDKSKKKFGDIAGLWFKERGFVEACKKVNPAHYPLIRKSTKINRHIFKKLKTMKSKFSYQDIKSFGRIHSQANKAIRCWKKNGLVKRIGWNEYEFL